MAKRKIEKLSEDELKSLFDWQVDNAIGRHDGELSDQRRRSLEFYYGDYIGNEVEGRSQVVSHDVFEVVEWAMPHIMKVFTSMDNIAEFEPHGPEDEAEAKQATQLVNHIFTKENDGFQILHDMFKDALLEKTGVTKTVWDDTPIVEREEYSGLDDFSFQKLVSDDEVEVLEHTAVEEEVIDPQTQMPTLSITHDVVVERIKQNGRVSVEVVAPEELLVSRRARSLEEATFVAHRTRKSINELKQMFPDVPDEQFERMSGDDEQEWDEEFIARHDFDDSYSSDDSYNHTHLGRQVWLTEGYLNVDWDGDGYAELRKITKVSNEILENIPIDEKPFASVCPTPVPHKYYGLSLADKTMDIQLIKSTLIRNILDNIYNLNNGRFTMVEGQANLDDLLTSRPGGVVRVQSPDAVRRLDTPPLPQGSFDLLGYVDQIRDGRTGVSKFRTGIDPDVLNNAKAGPANAQMDAANARLEMMVRIFAETGVKQMFEKIYGLTLKHQDREKVIRIAGQWTPVDPTQWKGNTDVSIAVGLGHGNRDQAVAQMAMLAQNYVAIRQDPEFKYMVQPQNVFNMVSEALRSMGYKNVEKFISDPEKLGPPPPPPEDPKAAAEKMKAQIEMQKMQVAQQKAQQDMQMNQERQKLEAMRLQSDHQNNQQKSQIEVAKLQSELQAEQDQNQIEQQKSMVEIEKIRFEKEKLMAEMEMKAAEHQLKLEELELERTQERSVRIGE